MDPYLAILLLILIAFLVFFLSLPRAKSHSSLSGIYSLLDPPHPAVGKSLLIQLTQRAKANRRLIRAFELSNTFVKKDLKTHKTFVQFAETRLKHARGIGWRNLHDLTLRAAQMTLSLVEQDPLPFDTAVQGITLRVILVGLLGIDEDLIKNCSDNDIKTVTALMTKLWTLSKQPDPIPSTLLHELNSCLRRLLPDEGLFPNPLDIVIPAWEALWRVVAITIAHAHDSNEMRYAFLRFGECPSKERFLESGGSISVKWIIDETMRLHPPSKRIGRIRHRDIVSYIPCSISLLVESTFPGLLFRREYADVGSILQSDTMWGARTKEFDPSRHRYLCPEQEKTLQLVFGHGHLRCVAAGWAPMAVAVICAAILDHVDGSEYIIEPGLSIGSREGWDDWFVIPCAESCPDN